MKKNLAALIKVKTIVTLVVIIVFTVLALRGDIAPDNVMVIVSTVIAFYFGTQHEKSGTNTDQSSGIDQNLGDTEKRNETEVNGKTTETNEKDGE
ncbi:MAG: hypothetical protein ACI3XI_07335 [Eubacteriales bacterium]